VRAAARELGWKEGTVASQLARARQCLQGRLTRRGVVLAAGPLGLLLAEQSSAAVPALVAAATVRMAVLFAAGEAASAGGVSASVALLTKGILNGMVLTKLKVSATLVLTLCFLVAGGSWAAHQALQEDPAQEQRKGDLKKPEQKAEAPKTEEAKQTKKDYYGDPLPPGVLARMGTVQLRHIDADVRFSVDGKKLISAGGDGVIGYWDVASGKLVDQKLLDKVDRSVARLLSGAQTLSADGKAVVTERYNAIQVFDVRTGKERCCISSGKLHIQRAALSFDGKLLAAQIEAAKSIYLWDAKTGKELHVLDHLDGNAHLAFSPDGKLLGATGHRNLQLWDTETGVAINFPSGENAIAFVLPLTFSRGGARPPAR
jgi:hypothetical protein